MVWLGPVADPFAEERELCEIWFQPGLTDDDREWLRLHLKLLDKEPPSHDISWIQMERIR